MRLISTVTCPFCSFKKDVKMPENSCMYFYTCMNCGKILKPKHGDCCIFCSFGSEICPPKQNDSLCC